MNFIHTYFQTHGRLSRKQWWVSNIILWVLMVATTLIYKRFGFHDAIFGMVITLIAFWMRINVNIKRLHDQNRSGWWILFSEIPIVGWVYGFVVFGILKGDEEANGHGEPV